MFLTFSVGSFLDGTFITKYLKREIQHLKREVWKSPSSRNRVKKIHPTRISGGIRWQKRVEIDL